MFSTGYFKVASFRGVPIRFHWTAPIGALVFGRFNFVPGLWLGFFLVITIHEMGHAVLVHQRRLRALEIDVHGFGGVCRHERGSAYDQSIIAWGGVLAQALVLLLPAVLLTAFGLWPAGAFSGELRYALTEINLIIIAFNLIPMPPFDGHHAWKFPKLWWKRREKKPNRKAARKAKTKSKRDDIVRNLGSASAEADARRIAREALDRAKGGRDKQ